MTSIKENTDIHPFSYPGHNTFVFSCFSLLNELACLSEAKKK